MESGRYLIKIIKKYVEMCLFVIFLIIGMTFITGFYYDGNVMAKLDNVTVELGESLPDSVTNYIGLVTNNSNLTFEDNVPKDKDGHTTTIGKFSYYLVYNDNTYKFSKLTNVKAEIEVIDTVKPVVEVKDNLTFDYDSEITPSDIATCNDLSGCKMTITSDIDSTISGLHDVTIVAVDGAKNKTEINTTIEINEKKVEVPVYYSYYDASINEMNNYNMSINANLSEEEKNNLRLNLVSFAKQFIGNPYVYGGSSLTNGTDCSGFTMSVYSNFGYRLHRVSTSQGFLGIQVSEAELLPGDLVVYSYGHVGIYAGNGMMIHAATESVGIVLAPMFDGYRTYRRIIY